MLAAAPTLAAGAATLDAAMASRGAVSSDAAAAARVAAAPSFFLASSSVPMPPPARARGRPKGSGKLTETARRERRRVNNRKAAQRSTAKKLDRQQQLERDNLDLRQEIELVKRHLVIHQHLTGTEGSVDLRLHVQNWSQPNREPDQSQVTKYHSVGYP
jgi:hypothetical protein